MKPARFTYHDAQSLDEAMALLAEHGDEAKLIAGGQSLVAMMNLRLAQPEHLIDINSIDGLDGIERDGEFLRVGALARHADILESDLVREACPVLNEAASNIAHHAIRQRGTIGGSLSHADPAAEWPMIAILMAAEIEIAQASGTKRMVIAGDFIQSIYTTDIGPDEVLTGISFPCLEQNEGWSFKSFARRQGDYFIVAVGATLLLDEAGNVKRLRLALGGMESTAIRMTEVERESIGVTPDDTWIEKIATAARASGDPMDDQNADAEFRRELAEGLVIDALSEARNNSGRW